MEKINSQIAENDKQYKSKIDDLKNQENKIVGELDEINKQVDEAKMNADENRTGSWNLIAVLNDKINLCKGLEGKIKNYMDEFKRKDTALKQDKQGINNLKDKLHDLLNGVNSL